MEVLCTHILTSMSLRHLLHINIYFAITGFHQRPPHDRALLGTTCVSLGQVLLTVLHPLYLLVNPINSYKHWKYSLSILSNSVFQSRRISLSIQHSIAPTLTPTCVYILQYASRGVLSYRPPRWHPWPRPNLQPLLPEYASLPPQHPSH